MKKMCNRLILVLLGFAGFLGQAQEARSLTLDEAIRTGIQNSKSLKADHAKILQAEAQVQAAKNNLLPDLKITGSALALGNANVDLKMLPPGMGASSVQPHSAFYGMANLSLPLYAGGKIRYAVESARLLAEASKSAAENDKSSVAYALAQSYNNLFKASQMVKVLQTNLKASQERDKMFLNQENNGILARNDRLKANLQTSDLELQLLEAQNQFDIAMVNMNLLLGFPEKTRLSLDPGYTAATLSVNDVDYYIEQAFKNRKDLQNLAQQKKAAELGIKIAKAENLPSVVLTGGYVAGEIPKTISLYNATNIGVGLQYNLSNLWKKNADQLSAEAKTTQLEATASLMEDQIRLGVHQDFNSYQLASRKIEVLEQAQAQADENFRITENKFNNGLETMTNLLEADAAQIAAHINLENAKADAALAYRKLLQTSGILISE